MTKKIILTIFFFFIFLTFIFFVFRQKNLSENTDKSTLTVCVAEDTEGDFITSDNIRLHYWFYNRCTETATIFLHGGPGRETHDFRDTCLPQKYADRFGSLLLFDQRGGGESDHFGENPNLKAEDITFDRFIKDIDELKTSIIPNHPIVVWGRSFGGLLAAAYANSHPNNVKAYVLFSPGTFNKTITDEGAKQINALDEGIYYLHDFVTAKAEKKEQELLTKEYNSCRPKNDPGPLVADLTAGEFMNENEQIQTKNHYYLLEAMRDIPVFVQSGQYDGLVPPLAIETMKPFLNFATYFEIPEGGHFAAYAHPDEVYDELEKFFQNNHIEGLRQ